jgi:hypothetical protein
VKPGNRRHIPLLCTIGIAIVVFLVGSIVVSTFFPLSRHSHPLQPYLQSPKIMPRAVSVQSCQQLALANNMADIHPPPSSAFQQLLKAVPPTRRCSLAVVAAGPPRSGSTMQQKLILVALKHLNVPVVPFYWNYHLHVLRNSGALRHMNSNKSSEAEIAELRKIRSSQERIIQKLATGQQSRVSLLLKTHEFDSRVFEMCEKQLVFTTNRNLTDAANSAVAAGWARRVEDLPINEWVRDYDCWKQHGAIDIPYEDFAKHPEWHALMLAAFIGSYLDLGWDPALIHDLSAAANRFRETDANPGIPGRAFSGL